MAGTPNPFDNSDADNDGDIPANWDLGHVPTGTEVATFSATLPGVDDNCTFTAGLIAGGVNVVNDYTADLDLAGGTYTLTPDVSTEGFICDGSGEVDLGSATINLTSGTFDGSDQTTWVYATSTLVCTGTCALHSDGTHQQGSSHGWANNICSCLQLVLHWDDSCCNSHDL